MKKTQIIIVSDQAAPAFLAALEPELKPDRVVLIVTPAMSRKGRDRNIDELLRVHSIEVLHHNLPVEHDYVAIEESLTDMATDSRFELDRGEIYLNLTGGTKLIALAAQNVARELFPNLWRSFYVDLDTAQVLWIGGKAWPDGQTPQPLKFSSGLKIRNYLAGHGFQLPEGISRPAVTSAKRELIHTLVKEIGSLEHGIGLVNGLAQRAEKDRSLSVAVTDSQLDRPGVSAVLRHFEGAGCLATKGGQIVFTSESDLSFVKGGWLEAHIFDVISSLHGELGISDKACGLQVVDRNGGVKNEIDACFLSKNRLYVIECKTSRMDDGQKANDALYKLVNIHGRIGGLGAKGMFVSYRNFADSELKLAAALGVTVVHGREISNLRDRINSWVVRA